MKEESRKGYAGGGNGTGRNHLQEEGEIEQAGSEGSQKQLQQATNWRNHEGRCGRTGEPRVDGKPSRARRSGYGGWT